MEKQEYIRKLKEYTKRHRLSYADYYFLWSLMIRTKKQFELPDFELENPFLTGEDYKKLIHCNDQRIVEYYAHVMERAVVLSEQEPQVTRQEIKAAIDEKLPQQPSRSEIRDAVDERFAEVAETLPREEIKEGINEEYDKKEGFQRTDIESAIDGELELIPEDEDEKVGFKIFLTSINAKIADLLNGFAVIREEKTGRAHLYRHDAQKRTLRGKQTFLNNSFKAGSGYYVNFEEYVNRILDEITEKYPCPEEITFIRDDGEERRLNELLEEAFAILRQNGSIRFGKDIQQAEINSYLDLVKRDLDKSEDYDGEPLQVGIYVRRDILTRIFSKYRAKVTLIEEEEKHTTK